MADGVKEIHWPDPKQENEHDCYCQINPPEPLSYIGDTREEAVMSDPCRLGIVDLAGTAAEDGDQCHSEDDNTYTTLPLREATPEKKSVG